MVYIFQPYIRSRPCLIVDSAAMQRRRKYSLTLVHPTNLSQNIRSNLDRPTIGHRTAAYI